MLRCCRTDISSREFSTCTAVRPKRDDAGQIYHAAAEPWKRCQFPKYQANTGADSRSLLPGVKAWRHAEMLSDGQLLRERAVLLCARRGMMQIQFTTQQERCHARFQSARQRRKCTVAAARERKGAASC